MFRVPMTESNEVLLQHYREYDRTSPLQAYKSLPKEQQPFFEPVHRGPTLYEKWSYLPSSVILLITMHGRTKEPFLVPMNVLRYIATDFGAPAINSLKKIDPYPEIDYLTGEELQNERVNQLIQTGIEEKDWPFDGGYLKSLIMGEMVKNRRRQQKYYEKKLEFLEKIPNYRERLETKPNLKKKLGTMEAFLGSKHHEHPKYFKKGLPMFNKAYTTLGVNGRESHFSHSIYVRADLPRERMAEDVFFEIHTPKTTLEEILEFLSRKGVTDVTLFDLSCQGDTKDPIHHRRYG